MPAVYDHVKLIIIQVSKLFLEYLLIILVTKYINDRGVTFKISFIVIKENQLALQ